MLLLGYKDYIEGYIYVLEIKNPKDCSFGVIVFKG